MINSSLMKTFLFHITQLTILIGWIPEDGFSIFLKNKKGTFYNKVNVLIVISLDLKWNKNHLFWSWTSLFCKIFCVFLFGLWCRIWFEINRNLKWKHKWAFRLWHFTFSILVNGISDHFFLVSRIHSIKVQHNIISVSQERELLG